MPFYRCDKNVSGLEPFKHVNIPVGGYNVEGTGAAVSSPGNIKNVFPNHYKKMTVNDFEVAAHLGAAVYGGISPYSEGYTRTTVSNIKYDADSGTLTASVSVSRTGGNISQIFQRAFAKWKGTVNGADMR